MFLPSLSTYQPLLCKPAEACVTKLYDIHPKERLLSGHTLPWWMATATVDGHCHGGWPLPRWMATATVDGHCHGGWPLPRWMATAMVDGHCHGGWPLPRWMATATVDGHCHGALRTGRHPGSETSEGLPGEQKLYVRRGHMRSQLYSDELQTFRGEKEQRRHCENDGTICAVAECRCRHDVMIILLNLTIIKLTMWLAVWPGVCVCSNWLLERLMSPSPNLHSNESMIFSYFWHS